MINKYCFAIFATLFVIGCTPAITPEMLPLAESLKPQSKAELNDFSKSRQSFISQCSGCHFHMYPSEFTPRQWKQTMKEHVGRTHLNKVEFQKIIQYIVRASELSHGE